MSKEHYVIVFQDVSLRLSEEHMVGDLAIAPEQPSPVSVLDSSAYMEGSPSPVEQSSHTLEGENFFPFLTLVLIFASHVTCEVLYILLRIL